MLMAIIAYYNLKAKQYDIITAFLYAVITKHKIYVKQPYGFEVIYEDGTVPCCLLLKALYGLKQSPLLWFNELTNFLIGKGFIPLASDPCIFQHQVNNTIIAVYVDDLIMAAKLLADIAATAAVIADRFEMHDLGDVSFYLGCRIIRDRTARKL